MVIRAIQLREMLRTATNKYQLQAGITMIELIVVIAIVAMVSTVLIFNYSGFSTNVSVRNLAQEIALSVRKAQTFATSVQAINNSSQSTVLYPAYGMSFSMAAVGGAATLPNQKRFVLFADIPTGGQVDADDLYQTNGQCGAMQEGSECVEAFTISTADRIVQLCTQEYGCATSGTVNVVFRRPAPDATICVVNGGSCQEVTNLDVTIQSIKGTQRTVRIWNTGQISVQ